MNRSGGWLRSRWRHARGGGLFLLALVAALALYWLMLFGSHNHMRERVHMDTERLAGQTAHALTLEMNTVVRKLDYFSQHLSWIWLQGDINAFHDAAGVATRTLSSDALAQIAVANADGHVRYSSLSWGKPQSGSPPRVSIADREHFRVHAAADRPFLFISDPIKGRISQQWTIQFTRGLWRDGVFQGVLVLSISADHLATALKAIFPDPTDAGSLVKHDGTYLVRSYHLTEVLGRKLPAERPFIQHPERDHGNYKGVGMVDEIERFYSWRRVQDYPLVILVGFGSDKAMALIEASIKDSLWQSGAGSALLLIAGLIMSALWTQRNIRSADLQRVADALAVETTRLNTVLKCFPGGILIKDNDDRVVFVNPLWPRLLALPAAAAALQGVHDRDLRQLLGEETAAWFPPHGPAARPEGGRSREVITAQGRYLEIDAVEVLQDQQSLGSVWLIRDITERKQHELKLTELASTDTLTGLPNRRSFMQAIHALYQAAQRDRSVTGVVMMLDIDRFKRVNDTYGHAIGDIVLQYVANLIQSSIRVTDVPGRYGGEEFVVLQPRTTLQDGLATAERIRQAMEDSCIDAEGQEIRITISIGVSLVSVAEHPEAALQHADLALYQAKNTGRNRVCLWEGLAEKA